MQTIGDRIRSLRKEKGWTQRQLAEKLDCHINVIGNWEKQIFFPNVLMVIEMSEVFGVSTDYILKGGNR